MLEAGAGGLAGSTGFESGTDDAASSGGTIAGAGRPVESPAGTDSSSLSCGSAAGAPARPSEPPATIREQIEKLKSEQKALKAEAKKRSRDIRNAERRSKRLKGKVGGLTDRDLDEILRIRADAKAAAAQRAPARPGRAPPASDTVAVVTSDAPVSTQS